MRNAAKWGVVLLASLGALVAGCSSGNCPGHFKTCGNVCVDIYTDPANCGACGNACAAGNVCSNGTCSQSCPVGETACGASCRDLQTDNANCGACGMTCAPGLLCTAGMCGCPPGMPQCGPTVLLFSDVASVPYPTDPEALGATKRLKGSVIGPFTSPSATLDAAYDAGGFDVLVVDNTNYAIGNDLISRIGDWVSCGGRLVFDSWTLPGDTALQSALGVTTANAACYGTGVTPNPLVADTSAVNLWTSSWASASSPLTATQTNVWVPFCGSAIQTYQLTPAAGGSIAGRFTTAGTGPGAMTVTGNGHVIVNGFFPSDYRVTDGNANGVPDVQELYENQIAYLVQQSPAGLTCSGVETFDSGAWPIAPWTAAGAAYGSLTAACAHNGAQGFSSTTGGNGPGLWYYRTDVTVGNQGDKLSMWFQTPSTAGLGLFLLGFGSTATGGWSLAAQTTSGPGATANNLYFFTNGTWSTYTTLANVAYTLSVSTWYRLEVEFGASGAVTGRLYSSDGVTVLATLSTTIAGFTPGGVAIQVSGQGAVAACADTIKVYR